MSIPSSEVTAVLERVDLIGLVSEHVPLRRVGNRFVGLCPFHSESTPSFSVNPKLGVYYCFGCQVSGDAISFVRSIEKLDFADAVEYLANRVGISISRDSGEDSKAKGRLKVLRETISRAKEFFVANLNDGPNSKIAIDYLESRGISAKLRDRFQIGLSPGDSLALSRFLGVSNGLFSASGLGFVDSYGHQRDMFSGRIVFPIFDQSNNPVAFGGRVIPGVEYRGESEPAKYKNSPETDHYAKRRTLYGLNLSKSEIVHKDMAIICEGYTDVVAFFKVGLEVAVATCGTALTEEHLDRLKNFSKNIVLAFDGDKAGASATERIYEWERRFGLNVRVASFPDGEDPASLSLSSPDLLRKAIEEAQPFLSFRLRRFFKDSDLKSIEGRVSTSNGAINIISEHPNPLIRGQYLMMIADACRLEVKDLERRLERTVRARRSHSEPSQELVKGVNQPMVSPVQPQDDANVDLAPLSEDDFDQLSSTLPPRYSLSELLDGEFRPYNEAIRALIANPTDLGDYMPPFLFTHPIHLELREYLTTSNGLELRHQSDLPLSETARSLMARLSVVPSEMDEVGVIAQLLELHCDRTVEGLLRRIRRMAQSGNEDDLVLLEISSTMAFIRSERAKLRDSLTLDEAVGTLLRYFWENEVPE
ncbi:MULTISPECIES: DNA primase [Acidithrix]|nr:MULTISPECIES: DNA primase [Acidithrix]